MSVWVIPSGPARSAAICGIWAARHHHRVRVDQVGLHGDGQRLAVRGRDRAAHGGHALALQPLVLRELQVGAAIQSPGAGPAGRRTGTARTRWPAAWPQPPSRVGPRPQDPADHVREPRRAPVAGSPGRAAGRMPGRPGLGRGWPAAAGPGPARRGLRGRACSRGVTGRQAWARWDCLPGLAGPRPGRLDAPRRRAPRAGPGPSRSRADPRRLPRVSRARPPRGSRPPPRTVMGCNQGPGCCARRRTRRRWRSCRSSR